MRKRERERKKKRERNINGDRLVVECETTHICPSEGRQYQFEDLKKDLKLHSKEGLNLQL